MHTIEEMAKPEQEHKERIANMTAQYTAEQAKTAAKFDAECAEASSILHKLETQRVDLVLAIEALVRDKNLAQTSADQTRRETEDLAAMQKDFVAGMERDTEAKRQALKKLQVEELKLTGELAKAREELDVVEAKQFIHAEECRKVIQSLLMQKDATKSELLTASLEVARLEKEVFVQRDVLAKLVRDTEAATIKRNVAESLAVDAQAAVAPLDDMLALRKKELEETEAKLAANLTQFKDIELAKTDLAAKMLDMKFTENQNARKARELAEKETKLAALAAK